MLVQSLPLVELHTVSDMGPTRDNNEDYCATLTLDGEGAQTHLLLVADGLGGHRAGEVASRLAVQTIIQEAKRDVDARQGCEALVALGLERGSSDNISVGIARVHAVTVTPPSASR